MLGYYGGMYTTYWILIPAFILAMYAQSKVKSTYRKFSQVSTTKGEAGAEVARRILDNNGLEDVIIEAIGGNLTDHYDPRTKALRLSQGVYSESSLAAVGIAAHEVGHAIQHAEGYSYLTLRNILVPTAQFGSRLAFPLFFVGFIMSNYLLIDLGIIFFAVAVIFQLITLPVEFNASSRAVLALEAGGHISWDETVGVKQVLNAAALTYLAAVAVSLAQLMRLMILRNRR